MCVSRNVCVVRVFKHRESKKGKKWHLHTSMLTETHMVQRRSSRHREHKPQTIDTHTARLQPWHHQAQPSTRVCVQSILDQWVQSADRDGRQSKPDIKGHISNSRGRIHKKTAFKKHTGSLSLTHTHTQGLFQQHFQCWLNFAFEVQQLCSSNLRGICSSGGQNESMNLYRKWIFLEAIDCRRNAFHKRGNHFMLPIHYEDNW